MTPFELAQLAIIAVLGLVLGLKWYDLHTTRRELEETHTLAQRLAVTVLVRHAESNPREPERHRKVVYDFCRYNPPELVIEAALEHEPELQHRRDVN